MKRSHNTLSEIVSYLVRAQAPLRPSPPRIRYQLCIADSVAMRRVGHQITDCQWVSGLWGPHAAAPADPFAPDPRLDEIIATVTTDQASRRRRPRPKFHQRDAAILDEVIAATRLMPFVSLVAKASAYCDRSDVTS